MRPLDNAAIGKQIKRIRIQLGLSQEDLAEMIFEEQSLISRVESGRKATLPIDLLLRIAAALKVTVNDLCYIDDGPRNNKLDQAMSILKTLPEDKLAFILAMLNGTKIFLLHRQ